MNKFTGSTYKNLLVLVTCRDGPCMLKQPIAKCTLAMVDMCYNAKVPKALERNGGDAPFDISRLFMGGTVASPSSIRRIVGGYCPGQVETGGITAAWPVEGRGASDGGMERCCSEGESNGVVIASGAVNRAARAKRPHTLSHRGQRLRTTTHPID